ncbi:transcriptional regulator [Enterococcus faecium 1,230,933]|nr:transcriptional regulator [Enterococcus faecium 1,230,933]
MIKLLVVEDDKVLSNNIKEILAAIGEITQVYDGSEGLFELESGVYDLAILDLMMPEMNGYEVLAKIRKEKIQPPVLILTAKDSLEDKIEGFERGADDYLTKPFYREELIMRVKALLKRSLGLFDENVLKYKDISCDLKSNEVLYKEQVLPIQGKEFELLVYFLQNKGIILYKRSRYLTGSGDLILIRRLQLLKFI